MKTRAFSSCSLPFIILIVFSHLALLHGAGEPCSGKASLTFSVGRDGKTNLVLQTEKIKGNNEFWTFDLQSHSDDNIAVNRFLFPTTFGSCSTIRTELNRREVFSYNFNPVQSGGGTFIQTYTLGKETNDGGVIIRRDEFTFNGDLLPLIACRTANNASVFTSDVVEDESNIKGTVYATCFSTNDPSNDSASIQRRQETFQIRIDTSRTVIGRILPSDEVKTNLGVLSVVPSRFQGYPDLAFQLGFGLFYVVLRFEVTAPTTSSGGTFSMFDPDVTPTFRASRGGWRMLTVRNEPSENAGVCSLNGDGKCVQNMFFRVSMLMTEPPLADVSSNLEGLFEFAFPEVSCTSAGAGRQCNDAESTSTVGLSTVVTLNVVGGLEGTAFGVGVAFVGLKDLTSGSDASTRNLWAGELFGLIVRVIPTSRRDEFDIKLKSLLLCRQVGGDCSSGSFVLFSEANPGLVKTQFSADKVFQIDFTMLGLSRDPSSYVLTGSYELNATGLIAPRIVSLSQNLIFQGCPTQSSSFNSVTHLCDCKDGFKSVSFDCVSTATSAPKPDTEKLTTADAGNPATPDDSGTVVVVCQLLATIVCLLAALLI